MLKGPNAVSLLSQAPHKLEHVGGVMLIHHTYLLPWGRQGRGGALLYRFMLEHVGRVMLALIRGDDGSGPRRARIHHTYLLPWGREGRGGALLYVFSLQ